MGRRVLANGKAVATTTSDHTAKATAPDMRLQGQVPVPRKNWIDSKHLAANKTTNTKFDGGFVWKADTKCGGPPPSKAMPDDHLPGIVNGGMVDGCAEAMPGQGAPTVFVEGKKAICKDHLTFQNAKNTIGIIINAEDLAAYLAEPMDPEGEQGKGKKVKTKTKKTKAGDTGGDEEARQNDDDGNDTTTTNDVHPDCALEKFRIWEKAAGGKTREASDSRVLELTSDSIAQFEAGGKFCGEHPMFDLGGEKVKGPIAERSLGDWRIPKGIMLHKWWSEMRVVCDAHGKQMAGTLVVCSIAKWELVLGDTRDEPTRAERIMKVPLKRKFAPWLEKISKKLTFLPKGKFDFKCMEGSLKVAAAFKEEKTWECWCHYTASGEMLIFDAALKWDPGVLDFIAGLGPVGLAVSLTFDTLGSWLKIDFNVVKLEMKIGGKLTAGLTGGIAVSRLGAFKSGYIELKGAFELYASATLKLNLFEKIEGSMGIKASVGIELSGKLQVAPSGTLLVSMDFKGLSIKANLGIKIKLGWVGNFIPSWVTDKLRRAIQGQLDHKGSTLSLVKEWVLVDGAGKGNIFKTDPAIALYG